MAELSPGEVFDIASSLAFGASNSGSDRVGYPDTYQLGISLQVVVTDAEGHHQTMSVGKFAGAVLYTRAARGELTLDTETACEDTANVCFGLSMFTARCLLHPLRYPAELEASGVRSQA